MEIMEFFSLRFARVNNIVLKLQDGIRDGKVKESIECNKVIRGYPVMWTESRAIWRLGV